MNGQWNLDGRKQKRWYDLRLRSVATAQYIKDNGILYWHYCLSAQKVVVVLMWVVFVHGKGKRKKKEEGYNNGRE